MSLPFMCQIGHTATDHGIVCLHLLFMREQKMQQALARYERGEALVIPIIVRPVVWQHTPIGKLQTLPKNVKPVVSWRRQEEAFLSVVEGIQQAIEGMGTIGTTISTYQSQIHHTAQVTSVAWSPDGRLIASASLDHTIQVREVATGLSTRVMTLEG